MGYGDMRDTGEGEKSEKGKGKLAMGYRQWIKGYHVGSVRSV